MSLARASLCGLLLLALGCTLTLPFDEITGGPARGGPPPTAHWRFDQDTGAVIRESNGRLDGAFGDEGSGRWTANGRRGGGMDFPFESSVEIPGLADARFPLRATVALWARVTKVDGDGTYLFYAGNGEDESAEMTVAVESSGVLFERTAGDVRYSSSPPVPANAWVLVVVGWDIPANKTALLVREDGKEPSAVVRGDLPPGFALDEPAFVFLASPDGTLDDVRYWDRLLTDDELRALD